LSANTSSNCTQCAQYEDKGDKLLHAFCFTRRKTNVFGGCVQNLENALIFLAMLDKFLSKLRVYSRLGWMTKTHFPFVLQYHWRLKTKERIRSVRKYETIWFDNALDSYLVNNGYCIRQIISIIVGDSYTITTLRPPIQYQLPLFFKNGLNGIAKFYWSGCLSCLVPNAMSLTALISYLNMTTLPFSVWTFKFRAIFETGCRTQFRICSVIQILGY
jgi:hypothetical protein